MTEPGRQSLITRLPKVELHCHLEGSVRPGTVVDLARSNGVRLPVDDPTELYRFSNLTDFLDVYSVICASLQTADDFARITYEALQDAADVGVRYREMFFSPGFLLPCGVSLDTIWTGIRAGLADAHRDFDIRCRMIGPAENIRVSIDVLGCERIDHGVALLDDAELTDQVVDRRIPLTVCPISNVVLSGTVPSVADHPFAAQRAAGVLVTINSDDPGMSGTTIADDFEQVAAAFSYDFTTMAQIALDAIDASWAPTDERRALESRFRAEIDQLLAVVGA